MREMPVSSPAIDVSALRMCACTALTRGDAGSAVAELSQAAKLAPENAAVLVELGRAYRMAQRYDAARYVLERAVEQGGCNPEARLVLAQVLELDERGELALLQYQRSLIELARAQASRDQAAFADAAIATEVRALIPHAQTYAARGRRDWFARALAPLHAGNAAHAFARVDAALAMYLGERPLRVDDARQRADFLYMPGIATSCFLESAQLDFLDEAVATLALLREECEACLAVTPAAPGARRMAAFSRGNVHGEARRHAPRLLAALGALPLARVPNHGPDCDILVLDAHGVLPQQYGRSNSRGRVIVNLAGCAPLQIRCGGETRELPAASGLALDPSFGVEVRNTGAAPARALSFEVWHPDLSALERLAMSTLIVAAVDFDTRLMELP